VPAIGAITAAARYVLAALMSGTLILIMYLIPVMVAAVIAGLVLGWLLPYHVSVIQCLDGSFRYTCP
jgi:predicted benzoate:H+ symporter BenE